MQIKNINTSQESILDKDSIEAVDNTSALLNNGISIYTSSCELSADEIIKTYPSGKQEIVSLNNAFEEVFIRAI